MNSNKNTGRLRGKGSSVPAAAPYDFTAIAAENLDKTCEVCGDAYDPDPTPRILGFSYFNPNPRGCVTGDCVKRAIVVASGKDYHDLELFMRRNKVRKDLAYNYKSNFEHIIALLGGVKISMSVPAGTRRWHVNSINKVMGLYPHISYCMSVSKHLIGVRDQTIFDLFDDRVRDKGIYTLFLFGATSEEAAEIQARCSRGDGASGSPRRIRL